MECTWPLSPARVVARSLTGYDAVRIVLDLVLQAAHLRRRVLA